MKILITGSSGFLGQYAVRAAMERGWDVDSLDRLHPSESRRMDVRLLQRIETDVVLHLAAFSSNAGFARAMADNYACNVFGTWNILRLAQQCGARVVYASSSAVYGPNRPIEGVGFPFLDGEDDRIPDLRSHYANSKRIGEMMASSFAATGLNALGLRIFNAYGPGDELKAHPSPVSQMQRAKADGVPFVCYGDGTQAKDFIHVSDVVEIIMRLIESKATGVVNVGTGVPTSFNDLARLIGCEMTYAPVPDPASYQYFTRADTERLLSIIGPYKFKSLEEGLQI